MIGVVSAVDGVPVVVDGVLVLVLVLVVVSVVHGVPVVVDADDGVLYGVHTKWVLYSLCMTPPCLWDVGCENSRRNVCLKFVAKDGIFT